MSGGFLPYRLRQNKAVDRFAFVELISKIGRYRECEISRYTYVGFGGPSLEDFKILHSRFGIEDMISLETDEEVYKRQLFNKPLDCIDCRLQSSKEFIDNLVRQNPIIVWLDYTDPNDLRLQIEEFSSTVEHIETLDVIKITLNSNPAFLKEPGPKLIGEKLQEARYEKLRSILGHYFDGEIQPGDMTQKRFPIVLNYVLRYAAVRALRGERDVVFQPLTAFSYADGQQMLTLTGIKIDEGRKDDFLKLTGIDGWTLSRTDWSNPVRINIPDLTLRERLEINRHLPGKNAEEIQRELGFKFTAKDRESLEMLRIYTDFYRHAPYFSEVVP